MSTHFDLSTYIYSNLLNSKNVPQQFAAAIANCRGSLDPISRAEYLGEIMTESFFPDLWLCD